MTLSKYITLLFTLVLFSCGNNPTDITEANTYYTDKSIDTIHKISRQQTIDPDLLSCWTHFQEVVSTRNYKEFKNISLDSLQTCDTTFPIQKFLNKCFLEVFDTTLLKKFADKSPTDYLIDDTERKYFSKSVLNQVNSKDSIIVLRRIQIEKELTTEGAWTMAFDFVKTKNGYRFYRCDSYGGPICCHQQKTFVGAKHPQ